MLTYAHVCSSWCTAGQEQQRWSGSVDVEKVADFVIMLPAYADVC
jgi:hypothetical protein